MVYSLINNCLREMVAHKFGAASWVKILSESGISGHIYSPEKSQALIKTAAAVLNIEETSLNKSIGAYIIEKMLCEGQPSQPECTFKDWLLNIDLFLSSIQTKYSDLSLPKLKAAVEHSTVPYKPVSLYCSTENKAGRFFSLIIIILLLF